MFPLDAQTHNLLAQERVERLRLDARPRPRKQRSTRPERHVPRLRPAPNRYAV
jgi:hypothetical protein